MTSEPDLSVEERIARLLAGLGIEKAHFTGGSEADYRGLILNHAGLIASAASLGEFSDVAAFRPLADRLLVLSGDDGPIGLAMTQRLAALDGVRHAVLRGYRHAIWSDIAGDRTGEVAAALRSFHAAAAHQPVPARMSPGPRSGEVAGITYRLEGAGPPLVLLPIGLAPSQWQPLVPLLRSDYCVISLSGAYLGAAALLEARGSTPGYLRVVAGLVEVMALESGQRVLEVGCGTGAIARWLARRTAGRNPITAVDLSPYLLGEAVALATREGLQGVIQFREANAESLPFADASFERSLAVTVLEEGDARRMLAELVRVTSPGGRVGVVVRADVDMPAWINLPLEPGLKARIESPGAGAGKAEDGVADAGLYRLFQQSGLVDVEMFPQYAAMQAGPWLARAAAYRRGRLPADVLPAWEAAVAAAEREGTFFIANPFHCAVGRRPL